MYSDDGAAAGALGNSDDGAAAGELGNSGDGAARYAPQKLDPLGGSNARPPCQQ